jgi:DNA-binding Lrp family transcriptional regulator
MLIYITYAVDEKMKAYMSLTCKIGAVDKVMKRLLQLNIPSDNIFQIAGPIDILVQFTGFKSLDEFIEEWFNSVRKIGTLEDLIARTLTFVVYSEGPSLAEKPFAFLLLSTQPHDIENVLEALLNTPEVLSADNVFGPYDIICAVKAKDSVDLEHVISKIRTTIPKIEYYYEKLPLRG